MFLLDDGKITFKTIRKLKASFNCFDFWVTLDESDQKGKKHCVLLLTSLEDYLFLVIVEKNHI